MIQRSKMRDKLKCIMPWVLIIGVMYMITLVKLPLVITNIFFVISTLYCMLKLWNHNSESRVEVVIICLGMLIRIFICILDVYGSEYITIPFSGDDSVNFYNTSVEYYNGDTSRIYTNYPHVLNAIYQITGLNRFAAQYVNILCWSISALIMQKSCYLLKIESKLRILAFFLLSFMPFNICISSILMRDMLVYLSISLAIYWLLKWMNDGKIMNIVYSIMVAVPIILIHNCILAMLLVIGCVVALYSPQKSMFCIEKKILFIFLLIVLATSVIFMIPQIREIFLTQIPFSDGGLLDAINGRLHYFYTHTGGSTYLLNEYLTSYTDLVFGTIQRIIYFLFSPVPTMWRGTVDMLSFFMSSVIYIVCFISVFISVLCKAKDSKRTVLLGTIICISAIFAWGVSNAGTAMRHREKLFFVTVLTIIYCIQMISKKKEGKL